MKRDVGFKVAPLSVSDVRIIFDKLFTSPCRLVPGVSNLRRRFGHRWVSGAGNFEVRKSSSSSVHYQEFKMHVLTSGSEALAQDPFLTVEFSRNVIHLIAPILMVAKSFNKKIQRLCQLSNSGRDSDAESPITQEQVRHRHL